LKRSPWSRSLLLCLFALLEACGQGGEAARLPKQAIEVNPALASEAQRDDDFKNLHANSDFLAATQE
jgi:hypothetical protein